MANVLRQLEENFNGVDNFSEEFVLAQREFFKDFEGSVDAADFHAVRGSLVSMVEARRFVSPDKADELVDGHVVFLKAFLRKRLSGASFEESFKLAKRLHF